MGEMSYITNHNNTVEFQGDMGVYSCLCTFPFNYTDKKLSLYTIASLALLGAGVAIDANTGGFDKDCWHDKNRYILDDCVPKWIREEIRRNLGMKTEDIDLKNEQL